MEKKSPHTEGQINTHLHANGHTYISTCTEDNKMIPMLTSTCTHTYFMPLVTKGERFL